MFQSNSENTDKHISSGNEKKLKIPPKIRKVLTKVFLGAGALALGWQLGVASDSQAKAKPYIDKSADNSAQTTSGAFQPRKSFEEQLQSHISENSALETELQQEQFIEHGDLKVYLDVNGFPLSYQLEDGYINKFPAAQRSYLEYVKKQALKNPTGLEPAFQVVQSLPIEYQEATEERPHVKERPDDILTAEELSEFGVTLFNPYSTTASKLEIRKSAFYGNNIFEPLRILNENLSEEEKKKIEIVMINGEWLAQEYTSQEIHPIIPLLPTLQTEISDYVLDKIIDLENNLRAKQAQKDEYLNDPVMLEQVEAALFRFKEDILYYSQTVSYNDIVAEMLLKESRILGLFYTFSQDYPEENLPSYVISVAPELEQIAPQKIYTLSFNGSGDPVITSHFNDNQSFINSPRIDQSFPGPMDFEATEGSYENESSYGYTPDHPGFVLRHELAHFILRVVLPELSSRGLLDKSEFAKAVMALPEVQRFINENNIPEGTFPDIQNEFITDKLAMKTLEDAFTTWFLSRYTDTSQYPFIFVIPPSKSDPGGYQYTNTPAPRERISDM